MKQQVWQLQDAKNRFSRVVEQAIQQGPQIITRHGIEAVIVMSYQEYRRMMLSQSKLSDFFRESPLAGVPLDLRRDKSGSRTDVKL
jgi:prevent-host-death family protein